LCSGWLAGNVLIGYLLICPLGSAVVCVNYLRFESGPRRQLETVIAGVVAAVGLVLLLGASVLANWMMLRLVRLSIRYAVLLWCAAAAVQAAPFAWFMLATDRTVRAVLPW
jgi:biotin transporter BioY